VATIERVEEVSEEIVEAFGRLVPQLSRSATPPSGDELRVVAASPDTALLVARDGKGGAIVGSLTLVFLRIPTGTRAWIEDVVVDESARGRGIGEALTREAIRLARQAGARSVDLTSHPARETANRLYRRLGFDERETNVYRYPL
jgi:ribosomal protein S18 acetylase RimI-like enzyme